MSSFATAHSCLAYSIYVSSSYDLCTAVRTYGEIPCTTETEPELAIPRTTETETETGTEPEAERDTEPET